MSSLKAELKRSFLQSLLDAVQDANAQSDLASSSQNTDAPIATLLEAIKAFQRQGFNALKSGRLSLGSTGLGNEVRWAPPMVWRSFTPDEVFGFAQEMREIYADAVLTLTASGNSEPEDPIIFAVMMADDRVQTVTSLQRDFTTLRWVGRY